MLKKFLLIVSLFLGFILISCEDDPILAPQGGDSEDGGSYGNLSLPGDSDKEKVKNPEVF
tara:strand:- start:8010 stop:8189 length:180 start_codon:yes stop_codon:yes gene_type:complete